MTIIIFGKYHLIKGFIQNRLDSQSEVEYGKNTVGSPKLSKKFDTTEFDGNIGFLLFGSWVSRIETFSFLLLAWIVREADILNQYDSSVLHYH